MEIIKACKALLETSQSKINEESSDVSSISSPSALSNFKGPLILSSSPQIQSKKSYENEEKTNSPERKLPGKK